MSRRQPIPGVDESALAELAGQFPSGFPRPATAPAQDYKPAPAPPPEVKPLRELPPLAPAAGASPERKAPGRSFAVLAVLLALLAMVIAATSVLPPSARSWLARTIGNSEVVDLVTGNRAELDNALAASSQSIEALKSGQREAGARLDAIETVIGSGAAMRRLDAVEAGLNAINERLATAAATDRLAAARAAAVDAKLADISGALKTVQDKLAADEQSLGEALTNRLGAVEADVGALQKIDRRPEKFFLAASQLRDKERTANPFAREVAAAQSLAGSNAEVAAALKTLAGDADRGVATVAELRDNFATIVQPRLSALAAANRGPVAVRAWDWVQSMFSGTASAEATGNRNAALVALAARSLDQGQLEAAVHQVLMLEDEAALVAAEWLKNASARLAADRAIATIMSQALDQLAASN